MSLDRGEMKKLWEEVKANHARLRACPGPHDFGALAPLMLAKYTCSKCKGTITGNDRYWYDKGLEHGAKVCGGALVWVPGEDGMQTTCPNCGKELMGLLDKPEHYPICMEPRR